VTTIRRAATADVPWLVELSNLPAVVDSIARNAALTADAIAAQVDAGERYLLLADDGSRAGVAGLRIRNERSRIADLYGVAVHPAHRGQGVARAGLAALVAHAFDVLGLHRLELEAYGYNDAAIALFRSMGFFEEGVRRGAWWRFDEWHDGVRFAVLSDDPRPR
jgi:RimJ/RimL family protein N-acetyltransferase